MQTKLFFVAILAFISIVAYQKYSEYSALKSVNSYESCVAAKGSIIQESYPSTCITRLGNRFISDVVGNESIKVPSTPDLSPSPTNSLPIIKVKVLDTSSWKSYSCGVINYKLPIEYNNECTISSNGDQDVLITKSGSYGSMANIMVREYDGGSRRQYWVKTIQASPSEITNYVRFQESQFGDVLGLDVFASNGWWQGGYASPILIAHNKTIISIHGGRNFNDQTKEIVRWDVTDSIASTIKFTN